MKLKKSDKYRMVNLIGMDKNLWSIEDTSAEIPTYYNDIGRFENVKPVCDLLNELDMNMWYWEHSSNFWKENFERLKKENEDLKNELELLNSLVEFDTL